MTLEPEVLDLDALQAQPPARCGSALPPTALPTATLRPLRPARCAKPSKTASAKASRPPWNSTGATGPTRHASWAWTPATCASWRAAWGSSGNYFLIAASA